MTLSAIGQYESPQTEFTNGKKPRCAVGTSLTLGPIAIVVTGGYSRLCGLPTRRMLPS
jgi:hypothetical protein